ALDPASPSGQPRLDSHRVARMRLCHAVGGELDAVVVDLTCTHEAHGALGRARVLVAQADGHGRGGSDRLDLIATSEPGGCTSPYPRAGGRGTEVPGCVAPQGPLDSHGLTTWAVTLGLGSSEVVAGHEHGGHAERACQVGVDAHFTDHAAVDPQIADGLPV